MPRPRSSNLLTWTVTVRNGAEVASAYPCKDLRHAIVLAVVVRRFWPCLQVAVRRYPRAQSLTVIRQARTCARRLVTGGHAAWTP